MTKPDDRQSLPDRARRYVRGIAVAVSLTFAALLFLYATLYGDTQTDAYAQPGAAPAEVRETGSLGPADTGG